MSINTRQTMQKRTYSLKNFEGFFDSEILKQYLGQDAYNQQLQQTQRSNSVKQKAIQQNIVPQQGQKQQQIPQQGQIRQKNLQQ